MGGKSLIIVMASPQFYNIYLHLKYLDRENALHPPDDVLVRFQ